MNTIQDKELFNQVALKIGCTNDNEAHHYVSTILHLIRDQISENESEKLIQQFSNDLFLIYVSKKPRYPSKILCNHLDHFAAQLLAMDQTRPSPLFHTKIEALRCSIILLHELDKRFNILQYLPYTFCQDLKLRSHEEA